MDKESTDDGALRELPEDIQRRTAERYAVMVVPVLRGGTTAVEVARTCGLTVASVPRRVP